MAASKNKKKSNKDYLHTNFDKVDLKFQRLSYQNKKNKAKNKDYYYSWS